MSLFLFPFLFRAYFPARLYTKRATDSPPLNSFGRRSRCFGFLVELMANVNLGLRDGGVHWSPLITSGLAALILSAPHSLPPTTAFTKVHSPWSFSLSVFFSSPALSA